MPAPDDVPEPGILPPEVAPAFEGHDPATAARMLELRRLIRATAAGIPAIGELSESLKWGQPSYTPKKKRIGSSVRLAPHPQGVAAYFICHTHLVEKFREIYPDGFIYEGNRALVFDNGAPLPEAELKHCFAMALTYHLK